ncbi:MAG: AraC-type DNA-binding protein [Verrucomicrobia bacterium]|nr:MAG: AraC-type DNA-binding protein [Verrucomicrobiota bacterium]
MNFHPNSVSEFFEQLGHGCGLSLFDAFSDTRFFIKNTSGVYMHASRVMHLAHGIADPGGIVGRTDYDFIPAYLADQYTRDDRQVLAGAEIWGRVEMVMRHPACPDWYVTSKTPLRDKNGRVVGLAGVSRDLQQAAKIATPFVQLTPVLGHIRDHFASSMEVATLAQLSGMSERSFQRHFKKAFQLTPTAYIRQFRIGKACQLLLETDATITTIALETGFSDHSHLVREFTRSMNTTPGAYRERYRSS